MTQFLVECLGAVGVGAERAEESVVFLDVFCDSVSLNPVVFEVFFDFTDVAVKVVPAFTKYFHRELRGK